MKLNKILMVLAATAIVGCTSDDLNDFTAKQAPEDSRLVELNPDFVLAGVGADGVATRTHWEWEGTPGISPLINKFLPIWATAPTGGNKIYDGGVTSTDADLEAQAVGLCWLGEGTVGEKVYTNYQFYHFGWLNDGETESEFECNELTNGALYDEITVAVGDAAGDEADETKFTLPAKSITTGLNYNTGVYKTDNKAIFGGKYIVYYPFNEDFKNAGTIPAIADTEFNPASTDFDTPEIGHATFRYSSPVEIEGGDQAADFGMYNLSSLVQLKVYAPDGDAAIDNRKVDQIVLYSKSGKLLKQANLAADKIVAGKKGAELYASSEGTKTISAKFAAGSEVTMKKKDDAPLGAFITVLPTTVDDLKVLVHSTNTSGTDGKWATIDKANTEFKAGSAKLLNISVSNADWKADYIAVDEASLTTALNEANTVAVDADHAATITVIGDITLSTNFYITGITPGTYTNSENITITGDAIIVPENVTLRVKTNMESDIRVLGKACCGAATTGGRLYVQGGTISNVTMEPTEAKVNNETQYNNYNPYLYYTAAGTSPATVAAGKTIDVQAGRVNVEKAVEHKGNIVIAEGVKVTVQSAGDLQFMGSTVDNSGTIEVKKNGKFDMTDSDGNATASDGERMTNNATGVFIHNVDAAVGTAVQSMHQNGEYRCRVNDQIKLDDAYQQWTACSVIEMVNPSPAAAVTYDLGAAEPNIAYKHNDKYIDIEVNTPGYTTVFSKSVKDDKVINIGNLTVTAGGLNINFLKVTDGSATRQRSLKVNGDMAVEANTTMTASKKIDITGDLTVEGATLTYEGAKANAQGLEVTGDIEVSGATFDADAVDAINIKCANFSLTDGATAKFGNRKDGATKTMTVSGEISNPAGCSFSIHAANQVTGSVLARNTCTKLTVGGAFPGGRPLVVAE